MDFSTDVVIVGAGGGGAVLGLALAKKGIRTVLLEQRPSPPQGLRGEILQPNGQHVLNELGLLTQLPDDAIHPVRYFNFRRVGGQRLCTVDYHQLPPPYNRALVMWPNVVHQTILQALDSANPGGLWYGIRFKSLLKQNACVMGVEAEKEGKTLRIGAKLVVGADGPFSNVRDALGIPTSLHVYKEGYLIAMLKCREPLDESQYFVGKRTILGIFPAAGNQLYVFYMIRSGTYEHVKSQGLRALQLKWTTIYPEMEHTFDSLEDWKQTTFLGTGRVRAQSWVRDGAVLIGDAAHGMNPHASQGRMQAMVDGITLAEVVESCMEKDDWSASALRRFEVSRRAQVTMLQRLADEEVFFWNTGNPLLAYVRDRVFMTLDSNRRLRYQVLTATAGLRETSPFGWKDRIQAAGFLPDPRANHIPFNQQLV